MSLGDHPQVVFKHLSNLEPETSTVSFHTLSCECEEPWQQIHSPWNLTEGVGVARVGPGRGFCLQFQFEGSGGQAEPIQAFLGYESCGPRVFWFCPFYYYWKKPSSHRNTWVWTHHSHHRSNSNTNRDQQRTSCLCGG